VKGGQTTSVYKSLARTLGMRKKCRPDCVFFTSCPVSAASFGYKDPKDPTQNQKCLMKEFPHTVRQQFIDLFLTGEEGMITAIKKAMHNYMVDVDAYGTLKDKRDMVQLLIQLYDKIYCNTRKGASVKEPLTITIRRMGQEPQTIDVKPHDALPPGVSVKDLVNPANADITEDDPESLINSPVLERLIRPVYEEIKIETNLEELDE
jgi:hypothetical protein